jgi:Anti-sigma factor N-terminus
MKRQGMVLEVNQGHAVVLTPDGDFCRIPRIGTMEVGMEVSFDDDKLLPKNPTRSSGRWSYNRWERRRLRSVVTGVASAVVIAAGVWLYTGILHPPTAEAYAWVSLDVNPSVSLEVDKKLNVRTAIGTDADGQALVANLKLQGLSLSEATSQVLQYASAHHDIVPQSGILVAVSPAVQNSQADNVSQAAKNAVNSAIQSSQSVQALHPSVFSVSVPPTIWKAASDAHISPGRLMSVLVAASEGEQAGLLDAQGAEIKQVWSNPKAKQAALEIGSNNEAELTRVLQILSDAAVQNQAQPNNGTPATTAAVQGLGQGQKPAQGKDNGTAGVSNSSDSAQQNPLAGWSADSSHPGTGQSNLKGNPLGRDKGKGVGNSNSNGSSDGNASNILGNMLSQGATDESSHGAGSGSLDGVGPGQGRGDASPESQSPGQSRPDFFGDPGTSSPGLESGSTVLGNDTQGRSSSNNNNQGHAADSRSSEQTNHQQDSAGRSNNSKSHAQSGQQPGSGADNHGSNAQHGNNTTSVTIHLGNHTFNIPLQVNGSVQPDNNGRQNNGYQNNGHQNIGH